MHALDALCERISWPRLTAPGPSAEQLARLQAAALRAPDHAYLRPWRFLMLEQAGQQALGEVFVRAKRRQHDDISEDVVDKCRGMPLRAPLLMVAIAHVQEHPKVPEIEQVLSVGAAMNQMLVAAHAMGLGAIWRTGEFAYDRQVMDELGLAPNEKIVGFLYLGTPDGAAKRLPNLEPADFFRPWGG